MAHGILVFFSATCSKPFAGGTAQRHWALADCSLCGELPSSRGQTFSGRVGSLWPLFWLFWSRRWTFYPFYFSLDVNHDTHVTHVYIQPHMSHTYVLVNTFVDNSPSQVWSWSISSMSVCANTIPWMMIFLPSLATPFFFGASGSWLKKVRPKTSRDVKGGDLRF